ncbi:MULTISPECIES: hypothetical protein [Paraburkholderia]|uniref:Uncharacterized protein n=1 Tax=Paraburkholderia madseniana TaxID=2599607 RepID=A0AAP5BDU7_9BURK|nr:MULTISPECIES: hypothetical protein [Paraburkholderia]MCX4146889.1 hypothetical protein [Paraburkholderia madseniana]MDN7149835.1 hypothetical protein [Paraburkholderia sp. WS6]MDQ6408715.1 hypothetical protein [Paraburkholderia madseniana]
MNKNCINPIYPQNGMFPTAGTVVSGVDLVRGVSVEVSDAVSLDDVGMKQYFDGDEWDAEAVEKFLPGEAI